MVNFKKKLAMVAAISAALAAPTAALATNGYFAHGYGTKTKGTVGAGVALSQDAMAAATNPAGMASAGNRLDVGAAIFSPSPRSYTASTPTCGPPACFPANGDGSTVESENDYFLIPHLGWNKSLGNDQSIGVTAYGNGGMNTRWMAADTPGGAGVFGGGEAGVNLRQLFIAVTYAQKVGDISWGVSPILAYQTFEAKGLVNFGLAGASNDSANLTDNDESTSTGFGAKLGIQANVGGGVSLGASYQSKMAMSEFDEYAGLFAEQGNFDIPSTWTVGMAWQVAPKNTLVFDIQKIMYSDVPSISNREDVLGQCLAGGGAAGTASQFCLGGSQGAGFGWEDMTIVKLGYQMEAGGGMTYRAGYSKGDQPIPEDAMMFNILAPGVIEEHLTFGFTKDMSGSEINFAFMYALANEVSGTNNFDPGQTIDLEMSQYEFELSYGMKF